MGGEKDKGDKDKDGEKPCKGKKCPKPTKGPTIEPTTKKPKPTKGPTNEPSTKKPKTKKPKPQCSLAELDKAFTLPSDSTVAHTKGKTDIFRINCNDKEKQPMPYNVIYCKDKKGVSFKPTFVDIYSRKKNKGNKDKPDKGTVIKCVEVK